MISLFTRSPKHSSLEYWKYAITRLFKERRGPDAVVASLARGLAELKVPFLQNPEISSSFFGNDAVLHILQGVEALSWAITLKRNGAQFLLLAGPNLVVSPDEADGILARTEIDWIVVPSRWVADFYVSITPSLAPKIKIWAAGVAAGEPSTRNGSPIIYNKMGDRSLVAAVQEVLPEEAHVFTYGSFKREDYLRALAEASYMIYLSKSESQGLALQEAWAHDVPTLVNKSTHWESGMYLWDAPQINCPYLTPELGRIFDDSTELKDMIEEIKPLHPKGYCDAHLSDRASAKQLLEITRTMEKRT